MIEVEIRDVRIGDIFGRLVVVVLWDKDEVGDVFLDLLNDRGFA